LSRFSAHESITLRRTVRFGISFPGADLAEEFPEGARGVNGFAGIPPSDGFTAHHELVVECIGVPDACTGYLLGIHEIDAIVRAHVRPTFARWCRGDRPSTAEAVARMADVIAAQLPPHVMLSSLAWAPGPFVEHLWRHSMPDLAVLTERFEFSAAHRLHCPELSDEENRRAFGKCNHPNGHGHNYRIAVAVRVPTGAGRPSFGTGELEAIVARTVLERFDHKHLNVDCPEFASLNPSVENIARVCHGLLAPECARGGAELDHVTVWETEKTSATYPAR